jgi:peroxisomal 2,4-dienoyl-CoA reductase
MSAVLAVEEGPHGGRLNVIASNPIAGTEGEDRLSPKGPTVQNHWSISTGRKEDLTDIANAAVLSFSEAASFILGQALVVNGASGHLRQMLPYPGEGSILDPVWARHLMRARM